MAAFQFSLATPAIKFLLPEFHAFEPDGKLYLGTVMGVRYAHIGAMSHTHPHNSELRHRHKDGSES